MAVSPLIVPPASADRNGPSSKSKLSASAVTPNGTSPNTTSPSNGVGRDLAELMNEEEKHKYVKGKANIFPCIPDQIVIESREEARRRYLC
jgi:cyclin-dependent kinase 7